MKIIVTVVFIFFFSQSIFSQGVQCENWLYAPDVSTILDTTNTYSFLFEGVQIFSSYGYTTPGTVFGGGWSSHTWWYKDFKINYTTPDTFVVKLRVKEKLNLHEIRICLALQDTFMYSSGLSYVFESNGEWQIIKIETGSWLKIYNPNFYKAYISFLNISLDSCRIGALIEVDNFGGIDDTLGNVIYDDFNYGPSSVTPKTQSPSDFVLEQNYPNPFNPVTTIRFSLREHSQVSLAVFNSLGQEIKTLVSEEMTAGTYETAFDASDLPSGVYFYRLTLDNYTETKKMLILK